MKKTIRLLTLTFISLLGLSAFTCVMSSSNNQTKPACAENNTRILI